MENNSLVVRRASPKTFPLDPRHEQTRTVNIRPTRILRSRHDHSARLLSLPEEILWLITALLAEEDRGSFLSSFALASQSCRQLARPFQFADVWITRSETSWQLLRHMLREVDAEGTSLYPPIGTLVRSISFTIDEDLYVDYGFATDEDYEEWCEYWQGLINNLARVLDLAVPNLARVYWMDTAQLEVAPRLLLAVLNHASSSAATRCLTGLYFADYKFLFGDIKGVKRSLPLDATLPLRDLAFGFDENHVITISESPDGLTAYFAENILRRSSSTLESLAWNSQFRGEMKWIGVSDNGSDIASNKIAFKDGPITFPKLRKFWTFLTSIEEFDPDVLGNIMAAPTLQSFAPSESVATTIMRNGLDAKFPLASLRTFAVTAISSEISNDDKDYVDCVLNLAQRYGSRIEELLVYIAPSANRLAFHLSTGNFANLRSLCFSWPEYRSVNETEAVDLLLKPIGLYLPTLEELSFGFQPDDAETGKEMTMPSESSTCPHDAIMAAIAPLRNLARLCVFGDEYIAHVSGSHWSWHRFFKELVWFHQGRSFTERHRGHEVGQGQSWSDAIRGHITPGEDADLARITRWVTRQPEGPVEDPYAAMIDLTQRYAKALPKLQEFISGRILMEVKRE